MGGGNMALILSHAANLSTWISDHWSFVRRTAAVQ